MKEDFFSKFKDYNNELEKILEKKDFSKDAKNLLLSMFYKLESAYNDYEIVKKNVKSKQDYLENILNNVKQCNKIELLKPNTKEFLDFKNENSSYDVDLKIKKIKVIDNELAMLSAILELNDFKIYLNEEYNLIRNSFPYLLNTANDMSNTEVLRDFNAFSWNTNVKEIKDININLVYENIRMALSIDIINALENTNEIIDLMDLIKKNLSAQYDEKVVDNFLKLIKKISIIIYTKKSKIEKKRLLEEKQVIEKELEEINNKKSYVSNIINKKMKLSGELKNIDLILNDKDLLLKEYEKRNKNLSNYNKIFSLSHLTEKLQREREKILNKIEEYNKRLEPKNYLSDKEQLENDFNLLEDLKLEESDELEEDKKSNDERKLLYKYIGKLQNLFLQKILPKKIEKLETKEELIKFIYQLRYYNLLPYDEKKEIKDVSKFKEPLDKIFSSIIAKMYKLKMLSTMSTNEKMDITIVKNIFELRMIYLEEIYLELIKIDGDLYRLNIYDDKDTLEESKDINLEFNKKDRKKLKRKVKLF